MINFQYTIMNKNNYLKYWTIVNWVNKAKLILSNMFK